MVHIANAIIHIKMPCSSFLEFANCFLVAKIYNI